MNVVIKFDEGTPEVPDMPDTEAPTEETPEADDAE